ncbi:MAG: transglutaminase-like domain-containing protein [Pseudomonadota bacterium]
MKSSQTTTDDPRALLAQAGCLPDDQIDLTELALAFAALDRPRVGLDWYRDHLDLLSGEVAKVAAERDDGGVDDAATALSGVIAMRYGYQGDLLSFDDLQNANLMRVIDRRKGLPVSLSILYLHAGRAQGWNLAGLNFPGHFLIRLDRAGERAIIDPFNGGIVRTPNDLRDLLKSVAGIDAELEPAHYAPVSDRDILIRLQSNIKIRHVQAERYEDALEILQTLTLLAPNEPSLWHEAGLLNAQTGNLRAAVAALEHVLSFGLSDQDAHQTAMLLQRLKAQQN